MNDQALHALKSMIGTRTKEIPSVITSALSGIDEMIRGVAPYRQQESQAQETPTPTPIPTSTPLPKSRNPDFNKKSLSPEVEKAIKSAADEFGLPHDLMFDIAWEESSLGNDPINDSKDGIEAGIPVGLYQFRPNTWNGDLYNYAKNPESSLKNFLVNGQMPPREDHLANARAAAYLIKQGQLARWDASLPKWGKYYDDLEITDYYEQSPGHSKKGLKKKN